MDINIARTFLEVCRTLHFGQAAANLHVTTSAISARIRSLEDELETPLFVRLHNEIALTDAARRLIPKFRGLLQTWEQIRYSATVASASRPSLSVGFTPGLWACIEPNWVKRMLKDHADLSLKIESAASSDLFQCLHQGKVDVTFTVEPHNGDDIQCQPLGELALTLYADRPGLNASTLEPSEYIHVDWGVSFLGQLASVQPDYLHAKVAVSNVRVAADLLIDMPGATYMPPSLCERLASVVPTYRVEGAPQFRVPVYGTRLISNPKTAFIAQLQDALGATLQDSADSSSPVPEQALDEHHHGRQHQ